MTPVQPNAQFTVVMEAQAWNNLLAALADAPYKISAPLIQAVSQQLQEQADQGGGQSLPNGTGLPMSPPN